MAERDELWSCFAATVEHLEAGDDPRLWRVAVETIVADAETLCRRTPGKGRVFARLGRCSRWMSPHNKGSWFKGRRFAWPTGYGSNGSTVFGLPEFDWSLTWEWGIGPHTRWEPAEGPAGKRPLLLRIALPARTARHVKAVAHTLWTPGPPTGPKEPLLQGYAFEKGPGGWRCVTTCGREDAYDGAR